jgi:phage/plasmid-associated DNA primase
MKVYANHEINYYGYEAAGVHPIGTQALLVAARLNKPAHFIRNKYTWMYGVIVFRPRTPQNTVNACIAAMYNQYPINNGIKYMAVACIETEHLRGIHVVGDASDIARFWADVAGGVVGIRAFDIHQNAVCWTGCGEDELCVLYLDFDEIARTNGEFSSVWASRVFPAISLVYDAIRAQHPGSKYITTFNMRRKPAVPGTDVQLWKYSFHVYFYLSLVRTPNSFKRLLENMDAAPRAQQWTFEQGAYVCSSLSAPIYDTKVYGGQNQLFRGPACGKGGQANARMMAIDVKLVGDTFTPEQVSDPLDKIIMMTRVRTALVEEAGMKVLDFSVADADVRPHRSIAVELPLLPASSTSAMYSFMRPLIYSEVLPRFQQKRKQFRDSLENSIAVVPVTDLVYSYDRQGDRKPHLRFIKIIGDDLCMIDPKNRHTQNPDTICIVVDLKACRIWQHCFACDADSVKYHWLHTPDTIEIAAPDECEMKHESFFSCSNQPHSFFLRYYRDIIIRNQMRDCIFVYDKSLRVWTGGVSANSVIGELAADLNRLYVNYLHERQVLIASAAIKRKCLELEQKGASPDEMEERRKEIKMEVHAEGRKFLKQNQLIVKFAAGSRSKLVDDLRNFHVYALVDAMHPFAHLIPMRNSKTFNVFTGEIADIKPEQYFTYLLDAELTDSADDIKEIENWFSEITCGNPEVASYLQLIGGYCCTMLVHDRHFYVLVGSGKNGKGTFKEFLVRILTGAYGTACGWKALNQNYWTLNGNRSTNSENASPETYGLLDKSLFYTDDMGRHAIDTSKLKSIVASEQMSGRKLYGGSLVVEPKGKVLWTSNHDTQMDGNDNAAWERYIKIAFLAKYVETADKVDHSMHRFLQNKVRYANLLSKRDAFFTVCVKRLQAYYAAIEKHPVTGEPLDMGSFKIPESIQQLKIDARALQLPLANFIKIYTVNVVEPLQFTAVDDMFEAYLVFLENANEVTKHHK